jgi:hypothetical protein
LQIFHIVQKLYPIMGRLENPIQCLVLRKLPLDIQAAALTLDSAILLRTDARLPGIEQVTPILVQRIYRSGSLYNYLALALFYYLDSNDIIYVHGLVFFAGSLALARPVQCMPQITVYLL